MNLKFEELKAAYPSNNRNELFELVLGGGFKNLVSDENYRNTCAIRMSVALNKLEDNHKIPKNYGEIDGNHKDQYGNYILIRMKTVYKYLQDKYGDPYWGMSKIVGVNFDFNIIPKETGILVYYADFDDAQGHVDIWNKIGCIGNCPEQDVNLSFQIALWKIDSEV